METRRCRWDEVFFSVTIFSAGLVGLFHLPVSSPEVIEPFKAIPFKVWACNFCSLSRNWKQYFFSSFKSYFPSCKWSCQWRMRTSNYLHLLVVPLPHHLQSCLWNNQVRILLVYFLRNPNNHYLIRVIFRGVKHKYWVSALGDNIVF